MNSVYAAESHAAFLRIPASLGKTYVSHIKKTKIAVQSFSIDRIKPRRLGYDVTLVKDATADYSDEFMHAALVTNLPNYASGIVTTDEIVDSISSLKALAMSAEH